MTVVYQSHSQQIGKVGKQFIQVSCLFKLNMISCVQMHTLRKLSLIFYPLVSDLGATLCSCWTPECGFCFHAAARLLRNKQPCERHVEDDILSASSRPAGPSHSLRKYTQGFQ